ncbi:MAG: alkaline phosphatase family protein [Sandaracinaceae bacterium]|nr:alkaline phosphatase family protein [Myxococcales bacterium]MCB9657112.1 alkaline phosphatase family protein [Sandaracinaceae bacterium]
MTSLPPTTSRPTRASRWGAAALGRHTARYALLGLLMLFLLLPPGCRCEEPAPPPAPRGRLVLSVVIDQLGSNTLQRFLPLLDEQGLIRTLAAQGVYHHTVRYEHGATMTAAGHATIYTGRSPREHGVVANMLRDRATGDLSTPLSDPESPMIGAPQYSASPRGMRGDSVSLALLDSTEGQGRVLSVSLKDRGAIPAAARAGATHAFWYESTASGFTTSTFYAQRYPAWFEQFLRENPLTARFGRWELARPGLADALQVLGLTDDAEGEQDWYGLGTTFPHDVGGSSRPATVFRVTPESTRYLLDLARAGVRALGLGEDDVQDLLAVSVSATDYAGHIFGTESWEYADTLIESDRQLGALYRWLSRRADVSVLLTSDHGSPRLPERAGTGPSLQESELVAALEAHLDAQLGPADYIVAFEDVYIYLTPAALERGGEVKALARTFLEAQRGIHRVFDVAQLAAQSAPTDPLDRAIWESVAAGLGGDLYVVPEEQFLFGAGYVHGGVWHGSPWDYDRNVPVLFMGPGVAPREGLSTMSTLQVAPTLCRLLGARALEGASMGPLPGAP